MWKILQAEVIDGDSAKYAKEIGTAKEPPIYDLLDAATGPDGGRKVMELIKGEVLAEILGSITKPDIFQDTYFPPRLVDVKDPSYQKFLESELVAKNPSLSNRQKDLLVDKAISRSDGFRQIMNLFSANSIDMIVNYKEGDEIHVYTREKIYCYSNNLKLTRKMDRREFEAERGRRRSRFGF
jgi:hypothetical protein